MVPRMAREVPMLGGGRKRPPVKVRGGWGV